MARGRFVARVALAFAVSASVVAFGVGVAQAATFATTVVTGDDAGEPGIVVGTDGALYIDAPSGLLSGVPGSPG